MVFEIFQGALLLTVVIFEMQINNSMCYIYASNKNVMMTLIQDNRVFPHSKAQIIKATITETAFYEFWNHLIGRPRTGF